jgi:hypothetical protein
VSAQTGAGKSFFINYLVYNYYGAGAKIRIIDIGDSSRRTPCSSRRGISISARRRHLHQSLLSRCRRRARSADHCPDRRTDGLFDLGESRTRRYRGPASQQRGQVGLWKRGRGGGVGPRLPYRYS